MLRYAIRRMLWTIPVLLLTILLAFGLIKNIDSNPFQQGARRLDPQIEKNLNEKYGLDKPWYVQYGRYVLNAAQGDLGPSLTRNREVADIIKEQAPRSAELGLWAFLFAAFFGSIAGIIGALRHNTGWDYTVSFLSTVGFAVPSFVIATYWVAFMGLRWDITPIAGWETAMHRIGPSVVLGLAIMPFFTRLLRGSMLEALSADHVVTARAKGIPWRKTVGRHVLRNSLIPVVTNAGPLFGFVITGSFIIEFIFAVPGVGKEFVQSVLAGDFNVVYGTTVLLAAIIAALNLVVDIVYGFLDPRIRVQ